MAFEHDFGGGAKPPAGQEPSRPNTTVHFKATLEGQRALKDGGLNITLGLGETEYVAVAKLLAMRGFVLNVTISPESGETFGGK